MLIRFVRLNRALGKTTATIAAPVAVWHNGKGGELAPAAHLPPTPRPPPSPASLRHNHNHNHENHHLVVGLPPQRPHGHPAPTQQPAPITHRCRGSLQWKLEFGGRSSRAPGGGSQLLEAVY